MRATLLMAVLALVPLGCGAAKDPPKDTARPGPTVRDKTSPTKVDPGDKGDPPPAKVSEKPPVTSVEPTTKTDDPPPKPLVVRPGDEPVRKAMRDIGIAHQLFQDARNRAPGSADDLEKYLDKGSKAVSMLKDGTIIMIWDSTNHKDPAKAVLAYEAVADKEGRRLVITADYAPLVVAEAEFQKMPKVAPKTPDKK